MTWWAVVLISLGTHAALFAVGVLVLMFTPDERHLDRECYERK